MANQRLTDKSSYSGTLALADLIHIVDVSDTSQNAAGSSYKLTLSQLKTLLVADQWSKTGDTLGNDTSWLGSIDNHDIAFKTNNTSRITILKTGEVGIGVSPTVFFHVKESDSGATAYPNTRQILEGGSHTYFSILSPSTVQAGLILGNEINNIGTGIFYQGTTNTTRFWGNGNPDIMIINGNTQRVGIGWGYNSISTSTSPSATLQILGEGQTSATYSLKVLNSLSSDLFLVRDDGVSFFNGQANLKSYTVATLPTGITGSIAYVTDALAPTFLATIVGGGAVVTPVFYNGTNWVGF